MAATVVESFAVTRPFRGVASASALRAAAVASVPSPLGRSRLGLLPRFTGLRCASLSPSPRVKQAAAAPRSRGAVVCEAQKTAVQRLTDFGELSIHVFVLQWSEWQQRVLAMVVGRCSGKGAIGNGSGSEGSNGKGGGSDGWQREEVGQRRWWRCRGRKARLSKGRRGCSGSSNNEAMTGKKREEERWQRRLQQQADAVVAGSSEESRLKATAVASGGQQQMREERKATVKVGWKRLL
ncbi:hypothetical protein GW17_00055676 [Ensete ventricosum]|nr:hypothetical protein GW17_00055676 [Ensete ventricosum]